MNNIQNAGHQLYIENKEYYQKLAAYIRYGSWLKSESEVEDFLYEVREDILDAQKRGVSAEDYFGKNPRTSADELLASLENKWLEVLKIFGIVTSTYLFFLFATAANSINIRSMLIQSIVITVATLIIFTVLKKRIYTKQMSTTKSRVKLVLTVLALGLVTVYDLTAETMILIIPLPYFPIAILFIIGALAGTIYYFKLPKERRVLWQIGLVAVWSAMIMGVANHIIIPFLANV
ncbi:hypothetical protein [Marinilactibacillus kalidii]|uniref:hypothetical protein n=1 Tax=Marinilactibacillus kalidii TaxID=2820274 RepID=UPI001ABDDBB0|nr:hypothetical protein [Marinilactibacillus kalidii]